MNFIVYLCINKITNKQNLKNYNDLERGDFGENTKGPVVVQNFIIFAGFDFQFC